jgi:muramoyltetrapeptide carboxypeptidase
VATFGDLARARQQLEEIGLHVELPWTCAIPDEFASSDAVARADQLREAMLRPDVSGIIMSTGGYNAIDVLDYLDITSFASMTPKIICGMSDISIFTTAFFARNKWQTYYGPNFVNFGEGPEQDHTLDSFKAIVMGPTAERVPIMPANNFGEIRGDRASDTNYSQEDPGLRVVHPGTAEGMIFGGNLGTLFLLQGTEYWPDNHDDTILFVEDDDLAGKSTLVEAMRRLRSLLNQPNLRGHVTGLVVGRFQKNAKAPLEVIERALREIPSLQGIPIVMNAPFGHTNPMVTIPIGGWAWLEATAENARIEIACQPSFQHGTGV